LPLQDLFEVAVGNLVAEQGANGLQVSDEVLADGSAQHVALVGDRGDLDRRWFARRRDDSGRCQCRLAYVGSDLARSGTD
jgi:hypothetical protein